MMVNDGEVENRGYEIAIKDNQGRIFFGVKDYFKTSKS